MRRLRFLGLCCAFVALGCGRTQLPLPAAPSPAPIDLPPPSPVPQPSFDHRLQVGELIKTRVTADDRLCGDAFPYRCRHYGLTPRTSGVLMVAMTWGSGEYPLDIGVYDPQGREWAGHRVEGYRREAVLPVTAGETYVIEVWSFLSPGEEFELSASLDASGLP
jgi:hypothetical protein